MLNIETEIFCLKAQLKNLKPAESDNNIHLVEKYNYVNKVHVYKKNIHMKNILASVEKICKFVWNFSVI